MMKALVEKLTEFVAVNSFRGKGPLCVGLVVTQHARKMGLPLDPETLITEGGSEMVVQEPDNKIRVGFCGRGRPVHWYTFHISSQIPERTVLEVISEALWVSFPQEICGDEACPIRGSNVNDPENTWSQEPLDNREISRSGE